MRFTFVALALTFMAVRFYWSHRARALAPGKTNVAEGAWVWLVRLVGMPIWMWVTFGWVVAPDSVAWAAMALPDSVRWSGAPIAAAGVALVAWVHTTLAEHFSPFLRIRAGHRLVTSGPYRWVRHPMYTAFLLVMVGFTLMAASWPMALATVGMWAAVVVHRTRREEAMLRAEFGVEWDTFAASRGALVPKWPSGRGGS